MECVSQHSAQIDMNSSKEEKYKWCGLNSLSLVVLGIFCLKFTND